MYVQCNSSHCNQTLMCTAKMKCEKWRHGAHFGAQSVHRDTVFLRAKHTHYFYSIYIIR